MLTISPILAGESQVALSAASARLGRAARARRGGAPAVAGPVPLSRPAAAQAGARGLELAVLPAPNSDPAAAQSIVPLTAASFSLSDPVSIGSETQVGIGAGKVTFGSLALEFPEITRVSQAIAQDERTGTEPTIALLALGT